MMPSADRRIAAARRRLQAGREASRAGRAKEAFALLEEAHVLGQPVFRIHMSVHGWMLWIGLQQGDVKEVVGQLIRLATAPFGHLTGRLPAGNTGGANVSAFRAMPVPPHLQELLSPLDSENQVEAPVLAGSWNRGVVWWLFGLGVAGLDWAAKAAVQSRMPYGEVIPITGFFNMVHVWNTGSAFSFLADAGGWQRHVLIAVALGAAVVLAWLLSQPQRRADAVAYSLILGGALGNALDRIVRGHVVDYLDFHWAGWHWPAFNVADIAICTGAALLAWTAFRTPREASGLIPAAKR